MALFEHLCRLDGPLRVSDLGAYLHAQGLPAFDAPMAIGSVLVAPIRNSREAVGSIYLAHAAAGAEFSEGADATLATFASQAALVIAGARRYRDERRARSDLETLLDTSPVGMLVFDASSGTAVRANREALRIVGDLHGPDESAADLLELMTVRRADGREFSLTEVPLSGALGGAETVRAEQIVLARAGHRPVTVLINATPVRSEDGALESVAVTMQDMAPLEEIDRLRADLLERVSEELDPPLLAIKGAAVTLLESLPALDAAETAQLVGVIDAQANRTRDLMGELLDTARIRSGAPAVTLEPTDVARLLDDAADSLPGTVTVDAPPTVPLVMADRPRIVRVLHNIAAVASRFSGPAPTLTVGAAHHGGHVRFTVTAAGPDVLADHPPWPPGEGPAASEPAAGGVPVAGAAPELALGASIIEAHGGRLAIAGDDTGGRTRYEFTVPIAQPRVTPTTSPRGLSTQPAPAATGILVIDDDPLTQRYINGTLTKAGYDVTVVADCPQALALLPETRPDLVVASLVAPDVDAIEIINTLRSRSDVPVILLTGYGEDQTIVRAMQAGAADYIVKPFSPSELDARIKAALHEHTTGAGAEVAAPFTLGDLTIDYAARAVIRAGRPVPLTRTEYTLLAELSLEAGRVLSHDQLMARVWRTTTPAAAGIVRSAIKRLRRKLGDDAANPAYIATATGVGYRLNTPTPPTAPHPTPPPGIP